MNKEYEIKKQNIRSAIHSSRNEPVVSLEDIANICKETFDKAEIEAFIGQLNEFSADCCEKCGEELGDKLLGDESYDYCRDCNWITH